ncbi:MAG: DUF5995 family protein [Anaerolineae bacterium]
MPDAMKPLDTAASIPDVIEALDGIIARSRQQGTRFGFFAALYRRTTIEVLERCEAGFFEEPERLIRLDVVFANRYLEAFARYQEGKPTCAAWQVAFEAAQNPHLRLVQHLVLGMNAHISFDLGLSVADISPDTLPPALHRDFDRLNILLAGLIDRVQREIARVSPTLGMLDRLAGRLDETLVSRTITQARDAAWEFAEQLVATPPEQRADLIAMRDRQVADMAHWIARPGPIMGPLLRVICWNEGRHIDRILDALTTIHG